MAAIVIPHPERVRQWSERPIAVVVVMVVVAIKGKEKGKWKQEGKVGSYIPSRSRGKKRRRVREVVIEGRSRGNN